MLLVNGAEGEGGGQIVRSSLALSLVTGRPVRIDNIRARRSKPGLMRQHLTAVLAAAEVGDAEVQGVALGSSRLTFVPRRLPTAGDFEFRVGTAGSTMLVLQTILAPLLLTAATSHLVLEGGTHNPLAPPFEFVHRSYLTLLDRMGPKVDMQLSRPGFYPAGGGRCEVVVKPTQVLGPLSLLERGALRSQRVRAVVANLPLSIAQRECQHALRRLDWPTDYGQTLVWEKSTSPGNVVFVELEFEQLTEVFTAYGERGKPAESVAEEVTLAAAEYLKNDAPVGEYLADQLLLPLGLGAHLGTGGGTFRTGPLTKHSRTQIALLRQFLKIDINVSEATDETVTVEVSPQRE